MSEATLTSKGRVTLPREIRQKLGLVAGDKLAFHLRSDGTTVIRTKTHLRQASTGAPARQGKDSNVAT